jgi:nitrate/TMAO reductase-like tetraheme cytochrome c subunit
VTAWKTRISEFFSRTRGRIVIPPIRVTGFVVALLLGFALILTFTSVQVTSTPRFCGSCHIMKPYYESWKHSSHGKIACVECHIAPGVGAEIRKKWEALSMVASYFTGSYGTNPWTEVDDAACLRCHERRLLAGKELVRDVLFDHSTHLSEMRRGKTLRCTSCHSQIVQGSHIAVTTSTCILCHFKGAPEGEGTTRCQLCHTVPTKTYVVGTVRFDHSDVNRFGMECRWCHARPAGSQGEVPLERCVTCHNQTARLEKYGETELLHRKHVSEHKIDCMDCHLHLDHVAPITAKTVQEKMQLANTRIHQAATDCRGCHETGHSPQLALYTGSGGRGVAAMPSPMFVAGVRCEGCHQELPGQTAEVNRASDVSCMTCHGPEYRRIYQGWKEGTARRVAAVRAQLVATEGALGRGGSARLADARFNLDLVERGHGVHNVSYAYALLSRSHDDLNAARRERGLGALPSPWREAPYESPCFTCHAGIEDQRGTIFGKRFGHDAHVISAKLECKVCHRTHQEKPAGEVLRYGQEGCVSCHHKPPVQVQNCVSCHADVKTRMVKSSRGDFDHKLHIEDAEKKCADCHDLSLPMPGIKKAACADCHDT